jgi:hypothetical protein
MIQGVLPRIRSTRSQELKEREEKASEYRE